MIRVTIFNEFIHEKEDENVREIYPLGIHTAIADFLRSDEISVRTVTLDDEECGLTDETLAETDVLLWWGHVGHKFVPDSVAQRVQNAVLCGMGFVVLHSGHHSKPFKLLMGTTCNLTWRENGDYERVWVIAPSHPIVRGIGRYIELKHEESYGEPFDVPEPDKLILIGSFEGGEVFRAGCCYRRGYGKIFYFQPGHEQYPTYYNSDVQTVLRNAVQWAVPEYRVKALLCPEVEKPSKI